jgi:DNA-binding transcriptional MocR family regulator
MIVMNVDRNSRTPVYQQIYSRIITLIEDGTLKQGDSMPTSRALAATLGVHRSTIVRAYEECRALGYLESMAGSYTRVRWQQRVLKSPPNSVGNVINWDSAVDKNRLSNRLPASDRPSPEIIDFYTLSADPALTPNDEFRRCIKKTLLSNDSSALDYTDAGGWPPLRETVAARLRVHGMSVTPDEILITNGAQQALDLIFRLLLKPGDQIGVEAPTYGMLHPLATLHGVQPLEIDMTPDGLNLDNLKKLLNKRSGEGQPKLIYTMPNFQNPTGITSSQAHREQLMDICEAAGVPIVEDGFEEEMKYFGKAVMPLKSIDIQGIVFYVGTFSKVIFSGLRIGWIAAPRKTIDYLARIQRATCISVNTLSQMALHQFCSSGRYEAHLRRIHSIYRRRMQKMLRELKTRLPAGVSWTRPTGGYTLWLTLPATAGEEAALYDEFRSAGVSVSPGRHYFLKERSKTHFRLSIACADESAIEEGCRRMGRVLASKNLAS